MTLAFTFNARACSGCKACQVACKDKNELPIGVLWRRVIEVSGGEWQQTGSAWENSVFAYNLSLACNHCVHPKCAGVCPVDAYSVRPDGIVLLDSSRCMGCGYCGWACPYDAPQYNPAQGVMTKCNFCVDHLDAGLPPACVAACPLRVLDFGAIEEVSVFQGVKDLWQLPASEHPFPLSKTSPTQPRLAIQEHPGMATPLQKMVSNREEIQPQRAPKKFPAIAGMAELPLVAFTLLTQLAVGMAVCALVLSPIPLPVLLSIGVLLALGGLFSFLHLGRKRNAWRAVAHLRKSWLSREILLAGLFGTVWLLAVSLAWLRIASFVPWLLAALGLGLVYSMARVYQLEAVPAWNTWRTPTAFFLSAAVLGTLGINLFATDSCWALAAGFVLAAELVLTLTAPAANHGPAGRLQIALLILAVAVAFFTAISPEAAGDWAAIVLLLIVLAAEAIGRRQFYATASAELFLR